MGTPVIATDIGAPPETVLAVPRAEHAHRVAGAAGRCGAAGRAPGDGDWRSPRPPAAAVAGRRRGRHVLAQFHR